jgi:arsenate reductase
MKKCTLYHNPRCSKSREALSLLEQHGFKAEVIEYLKSPPTVKELKLLLTQLGLEARDVLRKKEDLYKTLGVADPGLSDHEVLKLIHENPILLERPIVVIKNRAIIARPPELILELI